jgi:hypothetical protein
MSPERLTLTPASTPIRLSLVRPGLLITVAFATVLLFSACGSSQPTVQTTTGHVTAAEMNAYARALKHLQGVQYRVNHPGETPLRPGMNEGPVLVSGVTPFTSGTVVATVQVAATKPIASIPLAQVATAPIDASGRFVLRANPTFGPLADAIRQGDGEVAVNIEARQGGASRKAVSVDFWEFFVGASGKPLSVAKFRAAPGSGHWLSMHCGHRARQRRTGTDMSRYRVYAPDGVCIMASATLNLRHQTQYDR